MNASSASSTLATEWAERQRLAVVPRVEAMLDRVAIDATQRRLFALVRPILAWRAAPRAFCPAVHLPILTCVASGGDEQAARDLAAATTLLELSMDLLDRVWDRETEDTWADEDPRLIEMAGILLMSSVVPLALAAVSAPAVPLATLHSTVATRLLAIAAGELRDLATFGRADVTLDDATAATVGKTGERRALYAVLGAQLAGAPAAAIAAYDELGQHYGYARQVASDLVDLFGPRPSRDLASGSRTWPLAWMLTAVDGDERAALVATIDGARTSAADANAVREAARRLGVEARGVVEVELGCQRALAALARSGAAEPAAGILHAMIAATSLARPATNDAVATDESA
jgi:geranylgeranyl pyrophosphate synthase